jgi:hypothetical protein
LNTQREASVELVVRFLEEFSAVEVAFFGTVLEYFVDDYVQLDFNVSPQWEA